MRVLSGFISSWHSFSLPPIASRTYSACRLLTQWTTTSSQYRSKPMSGHCRDANPEGHPARLMAGSGAGAAQGFLVGAMWWYAVTVLEPARALKKLAGSREWRVSGELPERRNGRGLGPYFSLRFSAPVLLETKTEHAHLVDEFARIAEIYQTYVQPFSDPIFAE